MAGEAALRVARARRAARAFLLAGAKVGGGQGGGRTCRHAAEDFSVQVAGDAEAIVGILVLDQAERARRDHERRRRREREPPTEGVERRGFHFGRS